MFSKPTRKVRRPLAVRLTLWYAGVFTVSSLAAFGLLYALIVSVVRERTDDARFSALARQAERFR